MNTNTYQTNLRQTVRQLAAQDWRQPHERIHVGGTFDDFTRACLEAGVELTNSKLFGIWRFSGIQRHWNRQPNASSRNGMIFKLLLAEVAETDTVAIVGAWYAFHGVLTVDLDGLVEEVRYKALNPKLGEIAHDRQLKKAERQRERRAAKPKTERKGITRYQVLNLLPATVEEIAATLQTTKKAVQRHLEKSKARYSVTKDENNVWREMEFLESLQAQLDDYERQKLAHVEARQV